AARRQKGAGGGNSLAESASRTVLAAFAALAHGDGHQPRRVAAARHGGDSFHVRESGGEAAHHWQGGDGVANVRGVLGLVKAAGGLVALVCVGRGRLHGRFGRDLRLRRRETVERKPGELPGAETMSSLKV